MRQHVVHGVDAAEVVGVQHVLRRALLLGLRAELGLQQVHHLVEHREAGHAEPLAALLQRVAQAAVHQGEQHRPRFVPQSFQHAVQLEPGADQAPAVRRDVLVLEARQGRARHGVQRLAGAVGDEVQVHDALLRRLGHGGENSVDYLGMPGKTTRAASVAWGSRGWEPLSAARRRTSGRVSPTLGMEREGWPGTRAWRLFLAWTAVWTKLRAGCLPAIHRPN